MRYFLLVYDQTSLGLLQEYEFEETEHAQAFQKRFELERSLDRSDVEIVVLGAESREDLQTTHGRYFKSMADLLSAEG